MAQRKLKLPAIYGLAISPSGSYLAAVGRNVMLADLNARLRLASWHPLSHPSHVAFSRSESLLSVKSTSGEIVVLNRDDGSIEARYKASTYDEGASIHFSDCDTYLVDATWAGEVRVRRTEDLSIANRISFPGEMITEVSPSTDRKLWMFAHQPKTLPGENFAPLPYITLWKWPLVEPIAKFDAGFDIVYAATLSPCSRFVAIAGYSRRSSVEELRIVNTEGKMILQTWTTTGGTGKKIRWSSDSALIGTVTETGFSVIEAKTLQLKVSLDMKYPADLAFIDNNANAFAGTWNGGLVVPLG